ncbi:MAG: hypothetical protein R3256_02425 [Thalassovita sp.]|nr:hypothetical protein [Thalassovita sp.]
MKRFALASALLALMAAPAVAGSPEAAMMDPQVIESAASASDNGVAVVLTIALLTFLISLINPGPSVG